MNIFPPNCTILWRRTNAVLLDAVAIATTYALNATPIAAAQVEVTLVGTPTGTVTVTGTRGGAGVTEVLTWTGANAVKVTYKTMDVIISIATSLTGATALTARAMAPDGSPHGVLTTVRGPGWPAHMDESTDPRTDTLTPGATTARTMYFHIPFEYTATPAVGDLITNEQTGEVYRVEGQQALPSPMQPIQWQCRTKPRQP